MPPAKDSLLYLSDPQFAYAATPTAECKIHPYPYLRAPYSVMNLEIFDHMPYQDRVWERRRLLCLAKYYGIADPEELESLKNLLPKDEVKVVMSVDEKPQLSKNEINFVMLFDKELAAERKSCASQWKELSDDVNLEYENSQYLYINRNFPLLSGVLWAGGARDWYDSHPALVLPTYIQQYYERGARNRLRERHAASLKTFLTSFSELQLELTYFLDREVFTKLCSRFQLRPGVHELKIELTESHHEALRKHHQQSPSSLVNYYNMLLASHAAVDHIASIAQVYPEEESEDEESIGGFRIGFRVG